MLQTFKVKSKFSNDKIIDILGGRYKWKLEWEFFI